MHYAKCGNALECDIIKSIIIGLVPCECSHAGLRTQIVYILPAHETTPGPARTQRERQRAGECANKRLDNYAHTNGPDAHTRTHADGLHSEPVRISIKRPVAGMPPDARTATMKDETNDRR